MSIGRSSSTPYTVVESGVATGTYTLTATAYDNGGASTTSSPITITVDPHCSHFTVAPNTLTVGPEGGPATISVTTQSDCHWTASPGSWATLATGSPGTGSGTVTYATSSHYEFGGRSNTIVVAGQAVTLVQNGFSLNRLRIFDTFSDADGTALVSHQPETNLTAGSWSVPSGAPVILNARHVRVAEQGIDANMVQGVIDAGVADGVMGVDWLPAASGTTSGYPMGGLVFRMQDANNYWVVSNGFWNYRLALWRVANGQRTLIASRDPGDPVGRQHRIEVRMNGPSIEVWWDGERQLQQLDLAGIGATRHGLQWWPASDWQSAFDNFFVEGALPCVTALTPPSTTLPDVGGLGSVHVSAPAGCAWTAVSTVPWLTVGTVDQPAATIDYSAATNATGSVPDLFRVTRAAQHARPCNPRRSA